MSARAARRALFVFCVVALAFVWNQDLTGSRAQSIDDLNLAGGDSINVEDLLELLGLQNPAFPIDRLLFLLSVSWNAPISGPTPTATEIVGPTPTPTTGGGGNTFNLRDFFIATAGSTWHYIGFNGGSTDDNYSYTVENSPQAVGGGLLASRFRTDTDEPSDDRNGDVDFYLFEDGNKGTGGAAGDLFFFGLFKADGFGFNVNNIIATNPILLGGDGLQIGEEVTDTGAATVSLGSVDLTSTVRFAAFLPTFNTPLGTFTNVLKMELNLTGTVHSFFDIDFELFDNTVFLKEGVGIIAVDQSPDPNDAELLGIDSGTVYIGGIPVAIVAN